MYQNFSKTDAHKRKTLKDNLWATTRASCWMEKIEKTCHGAYKWLKKKPTQEWSRLHFRTFSKFDMLLNNLFESFNNLLLDVRDKPIPTMLEAVSSKL